MGHGLNWLPVATYRLQFNAKFKFDQAAALIAYLKDLGISDLYASPLFLAGPGSTHGYDVCDFDQLNPNLGSTERFEDLARTIRDGGMGWLLDMVPNHMGNSPENSWWRDVLQNGQESRFSSYFDINWEARNDRKILLPVLGDRYGAVLRRGELKVAFEDGEPVLTYYDKHFPLAPPSAKSVPAGNELEDFNNSPERLHALIQKQHYRLAFWRVGPQEINYRRFFDVTELVSVRVEDPAVFQATHRFVYQLLQRREITGLRIDHPDGLRDPKTYFDRLQHRFRHGGGSGDLFILAEKILSEEERLPDDWRISGTTGYDYLNYLNGVFVASANEGAFTQLYEEVSGLKKDYAEAAYEGKRFVLERLFPSELGGLVSRLRAIAERSIDGVDLTPGELRDGIIEVIAALPVYRTYARSDLEALPQSEVTLIDHTIESARRAKPELTAALEFLGKILERPTAGEELEFVQRFQQLSGPATAKGLEDTAFYRYVRFVSLNEVGGNPGQFGVTLEAFHEYQQHKQTRWPHSLLATATHDTKRGEDVRARLNVLSEMPEAWRNAVRHWRELTGQFKTAGQPSANDEYLIYQTLVGSWTEDAVSNLPEYIQRIEQYLEKATREAKLQTSWTDPDSGYEAATKSFARAILSDERFRSSLGAFVRKIAFFGVINSLSQLLLKIASPGVPDFYQGTELWDFNLVDPDNRRPVDYQKRQEVCERLRSIAEPTSLLADSADGAVKMFVMSRALRFRNQNRALFESGIYRPIVPSGAKREHVVAFSRGEIAVVVPRLPYLLTGGAQKLPVGADVWQDTELELPDAPAPATEIFTGARIEQPRRVADILARFPVALLYYGNTTR